MDSITIATEALESTAVAGSAGACVQCMAYLGLDGQLAAAVAVVVAVTLRMVFDYIMIKRKEKDGTKAD